SISTAARAGRCALTTDVCRFGFSIPNGAYQEPMRWIIFSVARLLWGRADKSVGEIIACKGVLYSGLIEPLLLAALNIDPRQGSAKLAAAVIRETLAAGGRACRPLIARDGLAPTMIEPALDHLRARGALVHLEHQLRA